MIRKNSVNIEKTYCLFCDKAFVNNVDQQNHINREHKPIKIQGRSRKSERIVKNLNSESSAFAGCFYCYKEKKTRTDDLDLLFQHLLSVHKDVYFGCKCKNFRSLEKSSLVLHRKNCKIHSTNNKITRYVDKSVKNVTDNRKVANRTHSNELKCDNLIGLATSEIKKNNLLSLPLNLNAIQKKSDRNKSKSSNKSSESSSGTVQKSFSSSSSSTSSRTSEEYNILTRQKKNIILKEPVLFRLGVTQNRSPANSKKSLKAAKNGFNAVELKSLPPVSTNSTITNIISPSPTKVLRTKTSKLLNNNNTNSSEAIEHVQKNEIVNVEFDEDFYKTIGLNIKVNLNNYIDGKIDSIPERKNRSVFDLTACGTQPINKPATLIDNNDREIHEATNFELSTPFPALLTADQYGFGDNANKIKRQITKNSWKWRWDLIKKYKYVNEGGKIVKKVKQITTGQKDLSKLDMWTQLSMRTRYENHYNQLDSLNHDLPHQTSRLIKSKNIEDLNDILDRRIIPEITKEQHDQTIIKHEIVDPDENEEMKISTDETTDSVPDILKMFNLVKSKTTPTSNVVLSGEWARPRCYICYDCGQKFDLIKSLEDHKNSEHPYVVSAHYEIVGRENLEKHLYKNLFLPKKALQTNTHARNTAISNDSKSNETTEASTSSENSSKFTTDQKETECSKCLKMIKHSSEMDIYRHILDCIGDNVWLQAKKRMKYRRSRRKGRKSRKAPQKKNTSSPTPKEPLPEGKNFIIVFFNDESSITENGALELIQTIPAPKEEITIKELDQKAVPMITSLKSLRLENKLNSNGFNNKDHDPMSIKNFFKVSKAVIPQQKLIVQVLEIPTIDMSSTLKGSLRSSAKKPNPNEANQNNVINQIKNGSNKKMKEDNKANLGLLIDDNNIVAISELRDETPTNEESKNLGAGIQETKLDILSDLKVEIPIQELELNKFSSGSNLVVSEQIVSPIDHKIAALSAVPESNASVIVPKKKKKLNDCIAMLTGKIQQKMGVDFFNESLPATTSAATSPTISVLNKSDESELLTNDIEASKEDVTVEDSLDDNYDDDEQNSVMDLSIKKPQEVVEDDELVEQQQVKKEDVKLENPVVVVVEAEVEDKVEIEVKEVIEEELKLTKEEICETLALDLVQQPIIEEIKPCDEVPVTIEENPVEKIDDVLLKTEPIDANNEKAIQSVKVSIPKESVPNLSEILMQYQTITLNNITISFPERKAFEEQKNRIMQILNKTNSLKRKLVNNKKSTGNKKKAVTSRAAKKVRVTKNENNNQITEKPLPDKIPEKIPEKSIGELIKSTNRMRCRRLSVLQDPILSSLASFESKTKKIRLTNNSQQNGFYDLLAAEHALRTGKSTRSMKKVVDKVKGNSSVHTVESVDAVEPVVALISKEKEMDATIVLEGNGKKNNTKGMKVDKEIVETIEEVESIVDDKKIVTKSFAKKLPPINSKTNTTTKKPAAIVKNQNKLSVEEKKKSLDEIEESSDTSMEFDIPLSRLLNVKKVVEVIEKMPVDTVVIDEKIDEKIDKQNVEIIMLNESIESFTDKKTSTPKKKLQINKKKIKQDTNPVNITIVQENTSTKVSIEKELTFGEFSIFDKLIQEKEMEKEKEIIKLVEVKGLVDESAKESLICLSDVECDVTATVDEVKASKLQKQPKDISTFVNPTENSIISTKITTNPIISKVPSFSLLEDSLFNDDLDNNENNLSDIVNNIINSSELLLDSELDYSVEEKNVISKKDDKGPKQYNCVLCKKTFRTDKSLEKHNLTNTHVTREQKRKERELQKIQVEQKMDDVTECVATVLDETKIFRTKGALKTFDNIVNIPVCTIESSKIDSHTKTVIDESPRSHNLKTLKIDEQMDVKVNNNSTEIISIYREQENVSDVETDVKKHSAVFNLFGKNVVGPIKGNGQTTAVKNSSIYNESEMDSSSTSWDLKHDVDIEYETDVDNVPFANAIKERFPKRHLIKINKSRETTVSIPTKSLIMEKIFKKHRDRDKLHTIPQANAPCNKPDIKNSLDEIFDHLKNTAEIDDKVLTCPSPKTLLKCSGIKVSPNSKDMMETASQSNNNNYMNNSNYKAVVVEPIAVVKTKNIASARICEIDALNVLNESTVDGDDCELGIGKRKSRRKCAIKAKTFAETWSSDEYEEFHESDIFSIIKEQEKQMSFAEQKALKKTVKDMALEMVENVGNVNINNNKLNDTENIVLDVPKEKKITFSDTIVDVIKPVKCDKPEISIKKRRMSCVLRATPKVVEDLVKELKDDKMADVTNEIQRKYLQIEKTKVNLENIEPKSKPLVVKKQECEKLVKVSKKISANSNNNSHHHAPAAAPSKKKHRKRPRNKIKNIAYDSDSDFELNLNKKSRAQTFSDSFSEEDDDDQEQDSEIKNVKATVASKSSNVNDLTMKKDPKPKLSLNDLNKGESSIPSTSKHVEKPCTSKGSLAGKKPSPKDGSSKRKQRNSAEQLYFWPSSDSETDEQVDTDEQGDDGTVVPDGDEEDENLLPQHGWIVGDSHKKVVALLVHAKSNK
ncbi:unnamed protein product [Diamesa serratosioi]